MSTIVTVLGGLIKNDNLMAAIFGAILGGLGTFISEYLFRKKDNKAQEIHYATILYYDLKSIEKYVKEERSSVDIRYYDGWQSIVANCTFLNYEYISFIYSIYDSVYNFDYLFKKQKENGTSSRKSDIKDYTNLIKYFDDDICIKMLHDLSVKIGLHK